MGATGGQVFPGLTGYIPPALFNNPLTDVYSHIATFQGTRCEQFELNFYRCCEAFGIVASKRMCDLEYRDLYECAFNDKQRARFMAMKMESTKQFLEGKRDRPYMDKPPTILEMRPDWYFHNDTQPFFIKY